MHYFNRNKSIIRLVRKLLAFYMQHIVTLCLAADEHSKGN